MAIQQALPRELLNRMFFWRTSKSAVHKKLFIYEITGFICEHLASNNYLGNVKYYWDLDYAIN